MGYEDQVAPPSVEGPEVWKSELELLGEVRYLIREELRGPLLAARPIEVRPEDGCNCLGKRARCARPCRWLCAAGPRDDPAVQWCLLAYASDLYILGVSRYLHGKSMPPWQASARIASPNHAAKGEAVLDVGPDDRYKRCAAPFAVAPGRRRRLGGQTTFTLVHLSDLHITSPSGAGLGSYLNKRASGWLSWKLRRQSLYRREVLEQLFADLEGAPRDHVVITGDLTNLSLEQEFREALPWLQRLGEPSAVTVVPGNHDSYVPVQPKESWDHWLPYMTSDAEWGGKLPREFPFVRVRGPVALIGLSSAVPTPWFDATGTLGADQLSRLEDLLVRLGDRGLCRVVLIHHPPVDPPKRRRRLRDSAALTDVLSRQGSELVLYGHLHDGGAARLAGPGGATIPALGVSAASCVARRAERRARYHRIEIEAARPSEGAAPRRFRLRVETRVHDVESGCFRAEGAQEL